MAALCLLSCATARSDSGFTFAVGANSHAQVYAFPLKCADAAAEGIIRDTTDEPVLGDPTWAEKLGLKAPPRKTTTHEEPAGVVPQAKLVQESRGSGVLEPLAVTLKAFGEMVGVAGGRFVVCIFTLGWRCQ